MARRYRMAWMVDTELEEIACERLHGLASVGELVEDWVWNTSWKTCRIMQRTLMDKIDVSPESPNLKYWRLWLKVIEDRLATGDRI